MLLLWKIYTIMAEQESVGMALCINGTAKILINGNLFDLSRGVVHLFTPIINVLPVEQSDDYESLTIEGNLEQFFPALQPIFGTILKGNLYQMPCTLLDDEMLDYFVSITNRIHRLEEEYNAATSELRTLLKQVVDLLRQELILECVKVFLQKQTLTPHKLSRGEEVMYRFIASVHQNYRTERQVSHYAEEAFLSPNHFMFVIKQASGKTPKEWIDLITMLHAKRQLSKAGMTVNAVAEYLNFPDQSTFGKYFRQQEGISPRQWQKEHQAKKKI